MQLINVKRANLSVCFILDTDYFTESRDIFIHLKIGSLAVIVKNRHFFHTYSRLF